MFHFHQSSRKPTCRCPPDINIQLIVLEFLHKRPYTLEDTFQFPEFESPSRAFGLRVSQSQIGDVERELMQGPFDIGEAHVLEVSTGSDGRVVEGHEAVGYQFFHAGGMYYWAARDR